MEYGYTEDLSKFGLRELKEAGKLLTAIGKGLPNDFYDDGIRVGFNSYSGYVFLVNSDYQACMLDDETGELYSHYSTPYEGREGSYEELMNEYEDMHEEDKRYMDDLKQYYKV
jgi:hypothetical protein